MHDLFCLCIYMYESVGKIEAVFIVAAGADPGFLEKGFICIKVCVCVCVCVWGGGGGGFPLLIFSHFS